MTQRTATTSRSATFITETTIGRAFKRTFHQAEQETNPTLLVTPPTSVSTETLINGRPQASKHDENQARLS